MKTIMYILTAFLTFSFSTLYASANGDPERFISASELAPVVPVEATFEESVPDMDNLYSLMLKVLAPIAPTEADFSDNGASSPALLQNLEPVLPGEADFSDSI